MTELQLTAQKVLAFGLIGWQELLILACPLFMTGLVLLILYLTGVIGGKKK